MRRNAPGYIYRENEPDKYEAGKLAGAILMLLCLGILAIIGLIIFG